MKPPIVIIGIGEIAGVLARAFLRSGHAVYPVTREMSAAEVALIVPEPSMVVVGVGEKAFSSVLETMPEKWRDRLVFIQNELLPRDWKSFGIETPTALSVWFEKKPGIDYKPLLPTPIYGPKAEFVAKSLTSIDIPCTVLAGEEDLLFELVLKNVFILTTNIAGLALEEGATTARLWSENRQLAVDVANDAIDLQASLVEQELPREKLLEGLVEGLKADPHHKCKGRSAPARLERALQIADQKALEIEAIRTLAEKLKLE